jgi:hypothetical protein
MIPSEKNLTRLAKKCSRKSLIDGLLEHRTTRLDLNPGQYATLAVFLVLFAIGTRTSGERYHGFAAVLFFLGLVGFLESLTRYGVVSP